MRHYHVTYVVSVNCLANDRAALVTLYPSASGRGIFLVPDDYKSMLLGGNIIRLRGNMTLKRRVLALVLTVGFLLGTLAQASYGIYVGKDLTADGSVFIGGSGDEPSSHWLVVQPREQHDEDATITVGVTDVARYSGELTEIPQVEETYKYIAHYYSEFAGFPPPLTNGGLNEHGVAGRDIWSPSNQELREMTPDPQTGPQYSDLSRIAMQRATSAREAVEIIGELIDEHGFSTYGGNSHMFADDQEGWVLIQMAGGQGLWVAERLASDEVRFSYPGYILEIPEDYQDHPDFMGSDNLIDFAVEQGWYDPDAGEPFNVNEIYGNQQGRERGFRGDLTIAEFEDMMLEHAPDITLEDVIEWVRDPRISLDTTGYGQVAQLHEETHPELRTLWAAATASVTTPFVPYYIGIDDVPPEFKEHRYLTSNEAASFQDPNTAPQEATRYAFRTFKRLKYHTCEHPEVYLPFVVDALTGFESTLIEEQDTVERTALALFDAGEEELARAFLTDYSHTRSMEALELGDGLVAGVEAHTKAVFGIRSPEDEVEGNRVHCYYPEYFEDDN